MTDNKQLKRQNCAFGNLYMNYLFGFTYWSFLFLYFFFPFFMRRESVIHSVVIIIPQIWVTAYVCTNEIYRT